MVYPHVMELARLSPHESVGYELTQHGAGAIAVQAAERTTEISQLEDVDTQIPRKAGCLALAIETVDTTPQAA